MSLFRRRKFNIFPKKQTKYALVISFYVFLSIGLVVLAAFLKMSSVQNLDNEAMSAWVSEFQVYIGVISFIVFLFVSGLSFATAIGITFRFAGPMVPLRRHIEELRKGNYTARVRLREYDEVKELAEDLNNLAAQLDAKYPSSSVTESVPESAEKPAS